MLVNNAGISYDHANYFEQLTADQVQRLINVNVTGTVKMTYIVLPFLLAK
jgi:short-subunit dehydrogenase